ncbi:hypothetical protein AO069_04295 [Pseudomonas syringae pv. syringae PD2774]|uniref:hypothetical protein n=1 Tax=Pseudomonas syringae TaxID=317 RepID=UPI0007367F7A|nr:hypothetical protein [Pseudomonas syringae]KTB93807.1 hypothetical protein AO069_04295 [Pseudomonas syringae pv. syringae PD2774]
MLANPGFFKTDAVQIFQRIQIVKMAVADGAMARMRRHHKSSQLHQVYPLDPSMVTASTLKQFFGQPHSSVSVQRHRQRLKAAKNRWNQ